MSSPKKPNTGQAPIIQKATPAAKLITVRNAITSMKPVRLSERCGVSNASNNTGSGAPGSKSLPAVMTYQYIPFMAKIIRAQRAKKASVRSLPKKAAKAKVRAKPARAEKKSKAPKAKAPKSKTPKLRPWTPEEVREAFERFRKANPEP